MPVLTLKASAKRVTASQMRSPHTPDFVEIFVEKVAKRYSTTRKETPRKERLVVEKPHKYAKKQEDRRIYYYVLV